MAFEVLTTHIHEALDELNEVEAELGPAVPASV